MNKIKTITRQQSDCINNKIKEYILSKDYLVPYCEIEYLCNLTNEKYNKEQILLTLELNSYKEDMKESDIPKYLKQIELIAEYFNWKFPKDFIYLFKRVSVFKVIDEYNKIKENDNYSEESLQVLNNNYNNIYYIVQNEYLNDILNNSLLPAYTPEKSNKLRIIIANKKDLKQYLNENSVVITNKTDKVYKDTNGYYIYNILQNWKLINVK